MGSDLELLGHVGEDDTAPAHRVIVWWLDGHWQIGRVYTVGERAGRHKA